MAAASLAAPDDDFADRDGESNVLNDHHDCDAALERRTRSIEWLGDEIDPDDDRSRLTLD